MSSIVISGDTSGSITLSAPAVSGSSVLTLPAVTDTVAGIAATQTLTNKSIVATQLTGTIAVARLPAGSVLQVVQGYTATGTTTSSATPVDTALSATITPTSASSKILVLMNGNGYVSRGSEARSFGDMFFYIVRGSTTLANGRTGINFGVNTWTDMFPAQNCYVYLDSPSTTSATTYKMQISVSNSLPLTVPFQSFLTMTLLEIAA